MFKNFYTTQMSANSKHLQTRFTKMRSKTGRFSKIMAVVMAVAILTTIGCATIVMAAVGSDGLEHWDKNEVYYINGMNCSLNINETTVPNWVNDIVGGDGIIDVSIGKYAFRSTKGRVKETILGTFTGSKGSLKLQNYSSTFGLINGKYLGMYFSGSTDGLENNFNIIPDDGRHIRISFDINENNLVDKPKIEFLALSKPMNFNDSERAENIFSPEKVDFIGDFNRVYLDLMSLNSNSTMFIDFEKEYKNKMVDGIDIGVISADNSKVTIKVDTKIDTVKNYYAYVYNKDNHCLGSMYGYENTEDGLKLKSYNRGDTDRLQLSSDGKILTFIAPKQIKDDGIYYYPNEELQGRFISKEMYHVEVALLDGADNVVYRYRQYVSIK